MLLFNTGHLINKDIYLSQGVALLEVDYCTMIQMHVPPVNHPGHLDGLL